jgi:hypothetical protein
MCQFLSARVRVVFGVCAGLGILLILGCNPDSLAVVGGTGTLKVLVTDKPYPFEFVREATVTVTRLEVHRVGSEGTASDGNGEENADTGQSAEGDDGGWETIWEGEKSFDLLDLRNGRTNLMADTELKEGAFNQFRIVVTEGRVVIGEKGKEDSWREFDLKVPSGSQSGIKLHFDFVVDGDQETVLLLDVDLSRAFQAIPSGHIENPDSIESFKFSPSLAMKLIDVLKAGSISGTVTDASMVPLANVAVTAYDGQTEVTTTATDADGTYKLMGLHTATYSVEFSAAGYGSVTVGDVAVTAGEATENVDATMAATAPVP